MLPLRNCLRQPGAISRCITFSLFTLFSEIHGLGVLITTNLVAHYLSMGEAFAAIPAWFTGLGCFDAPENAASYKDYCSDSCDGGLQFLVHSIFLLPESITKKGCKQTELD